MCVCACRYVESKKPEEQIALLEDSRHTKVGKMDINCELYGAYLPTFTLVGVSPNVSNPNCTICHTVLSSVILMFSSMDALVHLLLLSVHYILGVTPPPSSFTRHQSKNACLNKITPIVLDEKTGPF